VDVSKASPFFSIRDVITPFGLLRDTIPIPGPVVNAMADSITALQNAFAPSIILSPTSLTFTQTEGLGFGIPQNVTVSNGGVYGSLLSVSITSDSGFVTVNPANVTGLAFNGSGVFSVAVDSTSLLAANSPYSANITIQDSYAPNSPQVIPVTIIVQPVATIALTPTTLTFYVTANGDGTFPPVPAQTFQVQNTGLSGSSLSYQIQKLIGNSPWLVGFGPPTGTLSGGAAQTTTVIVQPTLNMQCGTYTETLRVSGYSSNFHQDLCVNFVVS
jgi:hypothetical protein